MIFFMIILILAGNTAFVSNHLHQLYLCAYLYDLAYIVSFLTL